MKKKTHEEYLAEFNKSQTGKLELISTYKSGHDKVTVRCLIHGNTFERVAKVFVGKGKGECSLCKKERVSKTHSDWLKEFKSQSHSGEYTVLSKYKDRYTSIRMQHDVCGHEWDGDAYHLVNGTKCPKCAHSIQESVCVADANISLNNAYKCLLEINHFIESDETRTRVVDDSLIIMCKRNDVRLRILINNGHWYSPDSSRRFYQRQRRIASKVGYELLIVHTHQWLNQPEKIKSLIRYHLKLDDIVKYYARKLIVRPLTSSEEKVFFDTNHLQNHCNGSRVCLGLVDQTNQIKCAMSFSIPRFNLEYQWELLRFTNKLNSQVVGGASKLLSYFIKNYKPRNIISYANLDTSRGKLYENLGFKFKDITDPSYFYVNECDGNETAVNRLSLSKDKMKSNPSFKFDPDLAEYENAKLNGYHRVWNSGNIVYVLNVLEK